MYHPIEMPFWGAPRSFIASAREHGLLAGVVRVVPNSFVWDGRLIEVCESWLQKTPGKSVTLYFTLNIDGKLQYSKNWPYMATELLAFKEDGTEHAFSCGHCLRRNGFEAMKGFIPIPGFYALHGWTIHEVSFWTDKVPKCIRLRAGRDEFKGFVPSEKVLTFELEQRDLS
jgi:hypothetical protein